MNPTTTLTNNNPPATHECGLNPSPICREESETPHINVGALTANMWSLHRHPINSTAYRGLRGGSVTLV